MSALPPTASGGGLTLALNGITRTFHSNPDFLQRLAQRAGWVGPTPTVHAVDGVDLTVGGGEVLGLVGESGCGKSTLGRIAAGILRPTTGSVVLREDDVDTDGGQAGRLPVQMIFQDPYASLNPRMRVMDIVGEAARVHKVAGAEDYEAFVATQMRRAGLEPSYMRRFPHEFSGGQRQRIGIARALAVNPRVIVCDEAVAALDVSIQAQVLNLFMDLRDELSLTYLFISHDLGVVRHISDRVAIMYLGRIVELAPTAEVYRAPNHPYTQALLAEVPRIDVRKKSFTAIKGEIPSPLKPPPGCHFHPRCPHAFERCRVERPLLRQVASGHASACHLNDQ